MALMVKTSEQAVTGLILTEIIQTLCDLNLLLFLFFSTHVLGVRPVVPSHDAAHITLRPGYQSAIQHTRSDELHGRIDSVVSVCLIRMSC